MTRRTPRGGMVARIPGGRSARIGARRDMMERVFFPALFVGLVLVHGFAWYRINAIAEETCESMAILSRIGE
jgi:hypothetical protein